MSVIKCAKHGFKCENLKDWCRHLSSLHAPRRKVIASDIAKLRQLAETWDQEKRLKSKGEVICFGGTW